MAKCCMIEREKRRSKLVDKYATLRETLREVIGSRKTSSSEKMAAQARMQKLPRDSNRTRKRNRCLLTGRPRGVYRRFGLGRNQLRELAMSGQIPGVVKASW